MRVLLDGIRGVYCFKACMRFQMVLTARGEGGALKARSLFDRELLAVGIGYRVTRMKMVRRRIPPAPAPSGGPSLNPVVTEKAHILFSGPYEIVLETGGEPNAAKSSRNRLFVPIAAHPKCRLGPSP